MSTKHTFNLAGRGLVKRSLAKASVPSYLTKFIESYLSGRRIWYDTDKKPKEYVAIAGIPQGSVLDSRFLSDD